MSSGGSTEGRASVAKTAMLWALRLGLGGLFVLTGALKVGDPAAFAIEIHNYQLFPALAPVLAAALPAVELAAGVAILVGPRAWLRAGALACTALMVVFTVAVGTVVARGINISCGCFGGGSGPVTPLTILRDVALLAACAGLLRLAADPPRLPSDGSPSPPSSPPGPARAAA